MECYILVSIKINNKTWYKFQFTTKCINLEMCDINDKELFFSDFPTNKTELHAVFDMFATTNRHFIEYKDFIEAMKPVRHVS